MDGAAPRLPKCVIIIRHAEKPKKKKKWWLNKKGQRRALYLSWYLRKGGELAALLTRMGLREKTEPVADAIFAMRQTQRKDGSYRSDRALQTVHPYARRLLRTGLLDNEDYHRWENDSQGYRHKNAFEKGREEEMIEYINKYYWGCRVLISWQHKNIKTILRAFGYTGSFKWKKFSYNRTVVLAFMNGVPVITEHKQEKKIKKKRIHELKHFLAKHE